MIVRGGLVVLACIGIRDLDPNWNRMPGTIGIGIGTRGAPPPPTEDQIIEDLPFASTEQVLIVYDEASHTEHLVMELRFEKSDASFGMLIPVPSAPAVEKVTTAPFQQLRDIYAFTEPNYGLGIGFGRGDGIGALLGAGHGGGQGVGIGGGGGGDTALPPPPPPIEVLDEHPVGSLTSFTLAVHDASELDAWMAEKHFAVPKAVGPWADRYARMDFQFVALKYTHDADAGAKGTTSQTVRITFPTPQIYFPYSEPVKAKLSKRLVATWVIGTTLVQPIARLQSEENKGKIAQPWKSGTHYTSSHDELSTVFKELASIIPAGEKLTVQTFRDWKTAREGWGDVVFVPQKPTPLDEAGKNDRRRLLGLLDPDLVPPPKPKPAPIASVAPAPSAIASAAPPPEAAKGCNAGGYGPNGSWLLVLAMIFVRRRHAALLLAIGCSKPKVEAATDAEPAAASASASASVAASVSAAPAPMSTLSPDDEKAHAEAAWAILGGDLPEAGVTVMAGIAPIPPPPIPAGVTLGQPSVTGNALDKEVIKRYVRRNLPRIKYCYENALRQNPGIGGGTVRVQFFIGPKGQVMTSNATGMGQANVEQCVSQVFRSMEFPEGQGGGGMMVVYPLTFGPPG